jgi:hypothetical protein
MAALGTVTPGNNLKIRAAKQCKQLIKVGASDTHSSSELREAVGTMAAGPIVTLTLSSCKLSPEAMTNFWTFSRKPRRKHTKLIEILTLWAGVSLIYQRKSSFFYQ